MRLLAVLLVPLMVLSLTGCATTGSHGTFDQNWPKVEPVVEYATAMAAQLAFVQPQIAPHKAKICEVVVQVSNVLDNTNANSLEALRPMVMAQVQTFISQQNLPPAQASVIIIVVEGVVTAGLQCAERNYQDILAQDQAKAVLAVAKALSAGMKTACAQ